MYVDKLDGKISVSFYERKAGEWRAEQDRIAEAMSDHRRADRGYADTGVELLELASGAHDAFMSQGTRSAVFSSSLFRTPPGSTAGSPSSSTHPSI